MIRLVSEIRAVVFCLISFPPPLIAFAYSLLLALLACHVVVVFVVVAVDFTHKTTIKRRTKLLLLALRIHKHTEMCHHVPICLLLRFIPCFIYPSPLGRRAVGQRKEERQRVLRTNTTDTLNYSSCYFHSCSDCFSHSQYQHSPSLSPSLFTYAASHTQ